jgi:ATP-dependent DNA helicase RecG
MPGQAASASLRWAPISQLPDDRGMTSTVILLPALSADLPLNRVAGIGPKQLQRLEKLGILTVRDLLFHLPRRYEDTRELVPLSALQVGAVQTARVRVRNVSQRRTPRKRMMLVEATLEDDGDVVSAVWFNQPFLMRQLHTGMELVVSGKVQESRGGLEFRNPAFERVSTEQRHVGLLAPVYPETEGLTSKFLRSRIEPLLSLADSIPDAIPDTIRAEEGLMPIAEALRSVHFPADPQVAEVARERIAFQEHFLLQLAAERARRRRLSAAGVVIPYDVDAARDFVATLPFKLTDGQRVAAHVILTDLAAPGPMNRLLQGDVGSGKTVVAAMAALMTHHAGMQTAVMAPTEILARQHATTLDGLLTAHGLPPRLLVGSTGARARREVIEALAAGHDALIVGTHALIEDDVVMQSLGLVVVDEQHRFGVAQRQRLRQKSGAMPNFLAMTATPIPRSLALTLYGDVDVSELREMPPGRTPVETRVVAPYDRAAAYDFVRDQVRAGRQAFVICPLIEESDKLGVRAATAEYERLRTDVFPDLRVELLHGRMPAREKEARMARFVAGEADLLVSTSVVEVGVDVPNATIMLIEGAERFGLAQLHQFRGRVGRGMHASFCLLFQGGVDEDGSRRLEEVARTRSGFDLADLDLRLRGPGDVVGMRQHGLPEMLAADLLDVALAQRARAAALRWLDTDPSLTAHAPLSDAMNAYRSVFDLD